MMMNKEYSQTYAWREFYDFLGRKWLFFELEYTYKSVYHMLSSGYRDVTNGKNNIFLLTI